MLKEKIKSFFAICILVLTIPYIVTFLFQGNETNPDQEISLDTTEPLPAAVFKTEKTDLDIEEYLAGIVAKQIPLDYQPEAIKAQAVIARTSLTASLGTEEQPLPDSMSREEMITLWGQDGFETNYHILEEAILDTRGEVLTYEGQPILAAFHAVSAGKTRNGAEASLENTPYLDSVECPLDIPSTDFLKVDFLEKEDFLKGLQKACPEFEASSENVMELFTVESRDSSDYVVQANAGEFPLTGESIRECLKLNSACFYIKEVEGKVRIVTKGLGHGLGLSQYAANEMAKEGAGYQEILSYFYKNAELSSLQ